MSNRNILDNLRNQQVSLKSEFSSTVLADFLNILGGNVPTEPGRMRHLGNIYFYGNGVANRKAEVFSSPSGRELSFIFYHGEIPLNKDYFVSMKGNDFIELIGRKGQMQYLAFIRLLHFLFCSVVVDAIAKGIISEEDFFADGGQMDYLSCQSQNKQIVVEIGSQATILRALLDAKDFSRFTDETVDKLSLLVEKLKDNLSYNKAVD